MAKKSANSVEKTVLTGKVKFFNEMKGYGFIKDDGSENDYFFHATGVVEKVKKDNLVSFELEEGQRGVKAVNVQPIP